MDYILWIDEHKDEIVKSVQDIVRIKSVEEDAVTLENGEFLPFGKGVHEAYQDLLSLGNEMGFETANFDNYGGHIDFKAEEPRALTFGIAAHLDVVPEGKGWTKHEPYSADIDDGFIYGRGTTDDKGPLIANLYAMKAIKECGIKPKKNIRLILGLDEETNQIGMEYYLEKAGAPDFGITPDGDFPLINGEMGILNFSLALKLSKNNNKNGIILKKLNSGLAPNIVPDYARAVIMSDNKDDYNLIREKAKNYKEQNENEVKITRTGKPLVIETKGKSAHGAKPYEGLNAISIMLDFLGKIEFAQDEINDFISFYNEHIGFNLYGEDMGIGFSDEVSGNLIFNVGMAEFNEDIASIVVNLRYPVSTLGADVIEGIQSRLKGTKIGFIKQYYDDPIYIEEDEVFVKKLMEAYIEETGDRVNKPIVASAGTYAKKIDRMLAYGALFPNDEDRMHQGDERLNIDKLIRYTKIYARAIYKLTCE